MTLIQAIIQGIMQGLTEFLPVSSSGHLSLFQYFTGQNGEAAGFFTIILHLGTLIAVCIAFYRTIIQLIVEAFVMIGDIFRGRFHFKTDDPLRKMIFMLFISLLPLLGFVFLSDFYKGISQDNDIVIEGICFLITAALLYFADKSCRGRKHILKMTAKDALAIGIAQGIAPLPGVSRSGSTIAVGMMCGLERELAVEFSFIMGIPTVLAANLLEFAQGAGQPAAISTMAIIAGVVTATVFGLLAIFMVRWLVKTDKLVYFAYYTFALGIITVGLGIFEHLSGHVLQSFFMGV